MRRCWTVGLWGRSDDVSVVELKAQWLRYTLLRDLAKGTRFGGMIEIELS